MHSCAARDNVEPLPRSLPFPSRIPPFLTPSSNSTPPLHAIQLHRRRILRPRPLPSHRQPHRMPPPTISTHIPQPPYILLHAPPQVILDRQIAQARRQRRDRGVAQL